MLVAWGFTSAFGPLLIAPMHDAASSNRGALGLIAGIMAISTLLPILVLPHRADQTNAIEVAAIFFENDGFTELQSTHTDCGRR
jgi:hypothetical protein